MKKLVIAALILAVCTAGMSNAASRDTKRPRVTYLTEDRTALVGLPAGAPVGGLPVTVEGRVTDDRSGLHHVEVTWVWCTQQTETSCSVSVTEPPSADGPAPMVHCVDRRRTCSFSAQAPAAPGTYWFAASAVDRAGNRSRPAGILRIVVV